MKAHHFHNEPLRCPECIRRFWKWVEMRTNSPPKKGKPNFYEHVEMKR